jgi:hypothetical protein
MRTDGLGVDSEERNSNEGTVSSQAQDGIAELEGSMVLICVFLVEVDICHSFKIHAFFGCLRERGESEKCIESLTKMPLSENQSAICSLK